MRAARARSDRGLMNKYRDFRHRGDRNSNLGIDGAATERIDTNSSRTDSRHKYSNKGRPCVVGPPWERFVSVPIFNASGDATRLYRAEREKNFPSYFFRRPASSPPVPASPCIDVSQRSHGWSCQSGWPVCSLAIGLESLEQVRCLQRSCSVLFPY